jgi:ubiquinone biosynthesis protein UbiJ
MVIDLIELACNSALEHDLQSRDRLKRLHGKQITLSIKPFGSLPTQHITINPQPHGLEFTNKLAEAPDVSLIATLNALVKISRDGLDNAELETGDLEINGDAIVGQRFAQILSELNIDWVALMAEHLGQAPAALLYGGAGKAKEFISDSRSMIKDQVSQILVEDLTLLVRESDVEPFLDSVDVLRADTDRLLSRLNRLQALSD